MEGRENFRKKQVRDTGVGLRELSPIDIKGICSVHNGSRELGKRQLFLLKSPKASSAFIGGIDVAGTTPPPRGHPTLSPSSLVSEFSQQSSVGILVRCYGKSGNITWEFVKKRGGGSGGEGKGKEEKNRAGGISF